MSIEAIHEASTTGRVLAAARELSPLIVQLRDETEALRLPPAAVVARLRDLRLCRLALGSDLHGHAMPIDEALDVYEQLSYAEASVGWLAWNNALPCIMSRYLESAPRAEVFGQPEWLFSCSTRPSGRATADADGYVVTGRWSIVSGCQLAEWIMLLCLVEEGGEPRMIAPGEPESRFVFVRRGSYEIVDTWHVGGLRGTGSHDVIVNSLRVRRELTFSPAEPGKLATPLGRVAIVCSMAAAYGALALGIARLAIDTTMALARTKSSPDSKFGLRESPPFLANVSRHTAALNAARGHLRQCARSLWQTAAAGKPPGLDEITATWGAAIHTAEAAQAAVDAMYAAGGIDSLYTSSPLERAHRDMHAMRRHIVGQSLWLEDAGRAMLGLTPRHPLYAL